MKKSDLSVGQIVYVTGYSEIVERVISNVGNKWFNLEGSRYRFNIETGLQDTQYSCKLQVYLDKQVLLDKKETEDLNRFLSSTFYLNNKNNLSLEKLRKIKQIIEE